MSKRTLFISALVLILGNYVRAQSAPDVPVVDFGGLQEILAQSEDKETVYVNFWATWCKPCVKEMPYINAFSKKYKENDKVKVILVSLDFPSQLESRVLPFIQDRSIHPQVVLLDDPDANSWIDKVHPDWSGAIPATIVYRGDEKKLFEQTFHSIEELEDILQSF